MSVPLPVIVSDVNLLVSVFIIYLLVTSSLSLKVRFCFLVSSFTFCFSLLCDCHPGLPVFTCVTYFQMCFVLQLSPAVFSFVVVRFSVMLT